jgi:hypothetical protein
MSQAAQDLVAELRGSGEAEPGQFSLDPREARERLRSFRLPEPFAYVLLLVRAAVRRGCTRLDLAFTRRRMDLAFDGPAFSREDLERLFSAPFSRELQQQCPGLRELALGVAAAARDARTLSLTSVDADGAGVRLEARGPDADVLATVRGLPAGTRLRVVGKLDRHGQAIVGLCRRPEERLVRERCRFAPVDVRIDGSSISQSLGGRDDVVAPVELNEPGVAGEAGFLPLERKVGAVLFLADGVVAAEEQEPAFEDGFVAVVRAGAKREGEEALRLDASESRVVQNAFHERAMKAARDAWRRSRKDRNHAACESLIDRRARSELKSFAKANRLREALFVLACVVAGWVVSSVVAFFLLDGDDLAKRLLDSMAVAALLGTLGAALLLAWPLRAFLVLRPVVRRFDLRYPSGTPLRTRMEGFDLRSEFQKARAGHREDE